MLSEIQKITDRPIDPVVKSPYLIWESNPVSQPADSYFTEGDVSSSTYIVNGMNNLTNGNGKQQ